MNTVSARHSQSTADGFCQTNEAYQWTVIEPTFLFQTYWVSGGRDTCYIRAHCQLTRFIACIRFTCYVLLQTNVRGQLPGKRVLLELCWVRLSIFFSIILVYVIDCIGERKNVHLSTMMIMISYYHSLDHSLFKSSISVHHLYRWSWW